MVFTSPHLYYLVKGTIIVKLIKIKLQGPQWHENVPWKMSHGGGSKVFTKSLLYIYKSLIFFYSIS